MNCAEFEQLMDAYLDGELSGSLRLEFDAHRLRCRRCQLSVAMMESVGDVLMLDHPPAGLSEDFTENVMARIERRRPLSIRMRGLRVALVAGGLLQAAAVLLLAIGLPSWLSTKPTSEASNELASGHKRIISEIEQIPDRVDQHEAYYDYVVSRVQGALSNLAADGTTLVRYPLDLTAPEELAQVSAGLEESSPLNLIIRAFVPEAPAEAEPHAPLSPDQHSL